MTAQFMDTWQLPLGALLAVLAVGALWWWLGRRRARAAAAAPAAVALAARAAHTAPAPQPPRQPPPPPPPVPQQRQQPLPAAAPRTAEPAPLASHPPAVVAPAQPLRPVAPAAPVFPVARTQAVAPPPPVISPPPPAPPAPPRPAMPAQQPAQAAARPAAPAAAARVPPPAVGAVAGAGAGAGPLRLLLVDDSAVVRAKLRKLFEPAGYTLLLARDGREALALLADTACALMITDLEMPELDGVGLIAALQAQHQSAGVATMPILAITGHDNLQERLAQLPGIQGLYRKPWQDDELLGRVRALVGLPSTLALH
jgi:CheY-like chemotaxis protein